VQFQYPYEVERDGTALLVHFPDVPGALTQVDPGENFEDAVRDCLVAALGGYVQHRLAVPHPTAAKGRSTIALGIMMSAKLALASAMAEAGMTNVELANRLGVTEKVVRRLLDLDHVSRVNRLEQALALLDQRLELSVHPVAAGSGRPRTMRRSR
jgi:antitoxin HicB